MKIRNLHIIVMLLSGIIVAIFSIINDYDLMTLIFIMLIVLIIFFTLGQIIQSYLNNIYKKIDRQEKENLLKDMEEELNRMKEIDKRDL